MQKMRRRINTMTHGRLESGGDPDFKYSVREFRRKKRQAHKWVKALEINQPFEGGSVLHNLLNGLKIGEANNAKNESKVLV